MKLKNKSLKMINAKGVGIIEALVAIVVFTIGLVGISKMMGSSLKSMQNSEGQSNIAILVDDLFERMNMLNAAGGDGSVDEGNIAKNAFLDDHSCPLTDYKSLNRCALGKASRQEWEAQLKQLLGTNSIISINVCRKDKADGDCVSSADNTKFIYADIKWKQSVVGRAANTDTVVQSRYTAQVSM